jgi:C-terminal processing protease CtpA/Prc
VDLRGNPGGTIDVAARLGDHIFPTPRPVGHFATRLGLAKHNVLSMGEMSPRLLPPYSGDTAGFEAQLRQSGALTLVVGGKAGTPYRGRIVLLIDEECGSTTEAVAAAAKEARAATLIGRRTAGAMLGADVVNVGGEWTLQLPVLDFRTARGVRVEGKGVTPHVAVKRKKSGDADLERALKFLNERR